MLISHTNHAGIFWLLYESKRLPCCISGLTVTSRATVVPVGQHNCPHTWMIKIKSKQLSAHQTTLQRCFPLTGHGSKTSFTSVTNEAQECSPPLRRWIIITDREDGFRIRRRLSRTHNIPAVRGKIQLVWETRQKWQTDKQTRAKTRLTKSLENVSLQKLSLAESGRKTSSISDESGRSTSYSTTAYRLERFSFIVY